MHSFLRTKVALWFFFVVVAVGVSGYAGFRRLSDYILKEERVQMNSELDHVIGVLTATNSTYLNLVHSSMAVLRILCQEKGKPQLDWVVGPDGSSERTLWFGKQAMTEDYSLVDKVKEMMGGTAAIFVKRGETFVSVATNVLNPDGSRSVGTLLDPENPAIAALRKGEAFYGVVEILGRPYITGYEPIRSSQGDSIGAFYAGFPLKSLSEVIEAVKNREILRSGFFALLDHNDKFVFHTEGTGDLRELEAIVAAAAQKKGVDPRWLVELRTFNAWDYDIIAALYLPDVAAATFERSTASGA